MTESGEGNWILLLYLSFLRMLLRSSQRRCAKFGAHGLEESWCKLRSIIGLYCCRETKV